MKESEIVYYSGNDDTDTDGDPDTDKSWTNKYLEKGGGKPYIIQHNENKKIN